MDPRAQTIISQITNLAANFGTSVSVSRTSSATAFDIYGNPTNGTTSSFNANIIIEKINPMLLETIAGGKPKVQMNAISIQGTFLQGDELSYAGRTYKVTSVQPQNFVGQDVVDFIIAVGEVNG